jgi:hypothetical protein
MKKTLAIMVGLLMVGLVFAAAQDQTATKSQEKAQIKTGLKAEGKTQQNKVQTKAEFRHRNRIAFIDENGDGINDLAKDHDGDGIPNGQDPDWTRPLDGSGYKEQYKKGVPEEALAADAKAGNAYQLARDDDGDGIPNGQDPDWVRPLDGSGYKDQHKIGVAEEALAADAKAGNAYQLARDDDGDGIPNGQDPDWVKPQDGSGYKDQHKIGKGSFRTGLTAAGRATGAGVCDGTGPKGTAQRKGRR